MDKSTHGNTTHGQRYSSEYQSWRSMKRRCYDRNNISYKYYGAIGIQVCSRWLNSFSNFFSDMGKKPSLLHTLDRKKTNKGYSKSNCRWATKKEQANNRRNNTIISYNGESKTLQFWADKWDVESCAISVHLKNGRSIDWIADRYESGKKKNHKKYLFDNKHLYLKEIATISEIPYELFRYHFSKMNNIESAIKYCKNRNSLMSKHTQLQTQQGMN